MAQGKNVVNSRPAREKVCLQRKETRRVFYRLLFAVLLVLPVPTKNRQLKIFQEHRESLYLSYLQYLKYNIYNFYFVKKSWIHGSKVNLFNLT